MTDNLKLLLCSSSTVHPMGYLEYCKDDVLLLREGCERFRTLFEKASSLDPFKNITIASACMNVFRSHFLEENTIGILTEADTLHMEEYAHFVLHAEEDGYIPTTIRGRTVHGAFEFVCMKKGDHLRIFKWCVESGCTLCFTKFQTSPF